MRRWTMTWPRQTTIPQLTAGERDRGLRALAELEHFREEMATQHGTLTAESWELLNSMRDERTRDLMRIVEA